MALRSPLINVMTDAAKKAAQAEQDNTPAHVVADRLKAIFVFSFFTIFFWFAFEQAGGSMTIFAADYTDRTLAGTAGFAFKVVNTAMTLVPAGDEMVAEVWIVLLLSIAASGLRSGMPTG